MGPRNLGVAVQWGRNGRSLSGFVMEKSRLAQILFYDEWRRNQALQAPS